MSIHRNCRPFPVTVYVVPRVISLGIGCRRGKAAEKIRQAAEKCLEEEQIFREAAANLASIDLKKEEEGICLLAEEWNVPFLTYDAEMLLHTEGEFCGSFFVKSVTGVDNVCERSAVKASADGRLIRKKTGEDGVTTALAIRDWRIRFE